MKQNTSLPVDEQLLTEVSMRVGTLLISIQNSRTPKAIFVFGDTEMDMVSIHAKRFDKLVQQFPDHFLGVYDSKASFEWLFDDVRSFLADLQTKPRLSSRF
ncbi:hypothetical protein SAMN05660653_02235 [Desulfonatronum thiosulfatophilum]|uniref:Uncharacterized protein n=1 Tax=Desulfonatronum thiosulfatophilum TaxID=617002 RepID=A0A1G6DKQ3_9BACT|nr:hypothetical protein [Desulfonatronum thiosulfatophilum]SDB45757.1 hypothetical protein SAMN05660653_02235 [Desulfonatronum thiosulfatophilum]